jgi:hypothetical protein
MADETHVPSQVTRAYRELGAEEPPRALDDAILAAARRQSRPWTRRWAVPLSLAAVLVLSLTVTLRIQHEQPGIELPTAAPAKQVAKEKVAAAEIKEPAAAVVAQAPAAPKAYSRSEADARNEPAPARVAPRFVPPPPAQPAPAPAPVAAAERSTADMNIARGDASPSAAGAVASSAGAAARDAGAASEDSLRARSMARREMAAPAATPAPAAKPAPMLAKSMLDTPERELERIAQLRHEAKHDEADKALAEFRKRYPDFRIPEAMLERLERR